MVGAVKVPGAFCPNASEIAEVTQLLGRTPTILFRVAARNPMTGGVAVLENLPISEGGAPNPNWFWLVDPRLRKDIDRLESGGGVRLAERSCRTEALARSHRLYASGRRDLARECGVTDPGGGVGGARAGVKCLHAHVAYLLAGGYSPVGAWALQMIDGIGRI